MNNFFAKDWTGAPFVLFGPAHLIGLLVVVLFAALLIILGRRANDKGKHKLRIILAVVLLITETSWHLWNYFTGQWTIQTMLPFHLCSALVWLSIYMLLDQEHRNLRICLSAGHRWCSASTPHPGCGYIWFPAFPVFSGINLTRSDHHRCSLYDVSGRFQTNA